MKKYFAVCYLIFLFNNLFSQQLTKNIIYKYSTSSCFVVQTHNYHIIGNASGFFLKGISSIYFITNNHVAGAEYALK